LTAKIGVLALQGDFSEHLTKLSGLGAATAEVRLPSDLEGLSGLIMPGGESTTFGKLAEDFGLLEPLREFSRHHALWGTCAGAIFMARSINRKQPTLGLMDITVERNAFGRQVDSFECDLPFPALSALVKDSPKTIHVLFIRAPIILKVGQGVEELAHLEDGRIVAARQDHWLATCFHSELTADDRLHRYFLQMASSS
jgi:5'-phosphate synthase pdxT subunit